MALAEGLLQMGSRGEALAQGQLRLAAVAGRAFFSRSISQNSQFDEELFFLCVAAGKHNGKTVPRQSRNLPTGGCFSFVVAAGKHKGKTVPRQTCLFRLVFARRFFSFFAHASRGRALADGLSRTGSRGRALADGPHLLSMRFAYFFFMF